MDNTTIAWVDVPIMWRGTTKTWEEKLLFCYANGEGCCCRRAPSIAACEWQVGWAATLIWWRQKSAATTESIWKIKREVLMAEDSDTKLRRNRKLNLLVSQSFSIYMCRATYNSKGRDYNTRIMPIIFSINTFYNRKKFLYAYPHQLLG